MINDLNRVQLMGYVGDDAKAPQTDNAPVCFSVATTDRWMTGDTRNTRTEWHSIAVFAARRDPDFAPVLIRHLRQKGYFSC